MKHDNQPQRHKGTEEKRSNAFTAFSVSPCLCGSNEREHEPTETPSSRRNETRQSTTEHKGTEGKRSNAFTAFSVSPCLCGSNERGTRTTETPRHREST